jgi:hypothetical protein
VFWSHRQRRAAPWRCPRAGLIGNDVEVGRAVVEAAIVDGPGRARDVDDPRAVVAERRLGGAGRPLSPVRTTTPWAPLAASSSSQMSVPSFLASAGPGLGARLSGAQAHDLRSGSEPGEARPASLMLRDTRPSTSKCWRTKRPPNVLSSPCVPRFRYARRAMGRRARVPSQKRAPASQTHNIPRRSP